MLDENLIATLEQSLLQTRNAQNRLIARLRESEAEVDSLRLEIEALENSAQQTMKAIDSLLVATRGGRSMNIGRSISIDDDTASAASVQRGDYSEAPTRSYRRDSISYITQHRGIPSIETGREPVSNRFSDRTITQACKILLRESTSPLHVNELYNLLVAGGMKFKGNNPTISVAVSLSRNRHFRKVDPGTFDLVIREAIRAVS
ncbi:MAG TPA: hypothetical protein VGO43_02145 [Pyrinomonadaceae bacterium]|jgi:hypothetical protein|nr:hypothetical protein [Pyrinomonadaceae bacterium]